MEGGGDGAPAEDEAEALGEIEGDEVAVEGGAGLLEGSLVGRAEGEDVVGGGELVEAWAGECCCAVGVGGG